MAHCYSPGCSRNDVTNSDQTLYFERLPNNDVWVVVCDKHADHDHATVELTDDVKQIPTETLSHLADELAE
jgi:hypothetical protein